MDWFFALSPVMQGLLSTLFTYLVTAAGAGLVFCFKEVKRKPLDVMMGFAAGVMIAASFWSLLNPAIELSAQLGHNAWLTAAVGFASGGLWCVLADLLLSRCRFIRCSKSGLKRSLLLTAAITMHNIPEGLAVGVAFGCAARGWGGTDPVGALMLAVGIGLQNFPEGLCAAIPLRQMGESRCKCFMVGQSSALVEPIAGVIGVIAALKVQQLLPFALTFSAGAMIAVVCSELIPESFRDSKTLATLGVLLGFVVMMVLDVALG